MNKDDIELAHFVLYHAKILLDHGAANTIAKELQDGELPYSKALSIAVMLLEQNGATPPSKSARDDLEKPCEPEFRNRSIEDRPNSHHNRWKRRFRVHPAPTGEDSTSG